MADYWAGRIGAEMALDQSVPGYQPTAFSRKPPLDRDDDEDSYYWSLERCKRCFDDYLDNKQLEINEQKESRRYRHGAQWTAKQIETFNLRKQPVVTYNRIGRKVDSVIGLVERLKQDPKAYPRSPNTTSEAGAELATACIRYVSESDLKDFVLPFVIENMAVDGLGGVEMLLIEGDRGDVDIGFALVETDSFFYDPRSFKHDFSDARFRGVAKWLDLEETIALAPDKEDEIRDTMNSGDDFTTSPDREHKWFMDTHGEEDDRKIRVVDLWYKHKGGWCWCLFTGSVKLQEGKGYFYDEKGKQLCKYLMQSCFIDHEGDRYGFIRNLRSAQDEINQRRSKGLHELNSRRITAEDGAFADVELTRREAVRPDGVVIYQKGFEMAFDDNTRLANMEGHIKFLEDAKNEIENFGPNPALIGQGLEYKSGRAINLLQQAGIAELGPFMIGVRNLKLRLYRAIWCAIQRYWEAERYIRVVSSEGIEQLVQINGVGIDPMTGVPRMINAVGQLDVNIILDEGPDEINMMGDAYDTLLALAQGGAQVPPIVLIELAPLHPSVKKKLLAMMSDPIEQAGKQIALEGAKAEVGKLHSEIAKNQAQAQEAAQGGAHGIVERQMDAQIKMQDSQNKVRESAAKIQTEQQKAFLKAQEGQQKIMQEAVLGRQRVQQQAFEGAQKMRRAEEQHRIRLAESTRAQQMKNRPGKGGTGL
jgi:hypothetical protein